MISSDDHHNRLQQNPFLPTSSLILLAMAFPVLALLLMLPLTQPIGAMYWDLLVYFDAANRLSDGQIPSTDFFAPVGPLGYYLFASGQKLFPQAQPLLLVQWSLLVVTGPLLALVLWDTGRRLSGTAMALLVPFLVFAILPFNLDIYSPYPGTDGYGIYNRQVCQLLYVLTASLIFLRDRRLLFIAVTFGMSALFLTKITGFLAGGLLCVAALITGRVSLRLALLSSLTFLALLATLQLWSGFTFSYVEDVLALVTLNSGTLAKNFLRAGAQTFGISAPATVLALLLLFVERREIADQLRTLWQSFRFSTLAALLDRDALWIGIVLFAGIFFETQNTGSQALIFIWPVVLAALIKLRQKRRPNHILVAAAVLASASALPPLMNVAERAARAYTSSVVNIPLSNSNLKTIGQVNLREGLLDYTNRMFLVYSQHHETFDLIARLRELPGMYYYADVGFQVAHLLAIDQTVADIKALEAAKGVRFETIMAINFVNPFPWLLDRSAPLHIAIGADPTRAVPKPDEQIEQAVRATDLALRPTCPITVDNADLLKLYRPALSNHRRIKLNECYEAYVHPRLASKIE